MTSPRVTLGVTAYNVERYLPQALDSVLAQDFTDFEVVICDNLSTDGTWDICERYAEKDHRIRIHRNPENLGETGNFHRVVELSRGEFFRLTAHDDLMAPTLLGRCVAALDAAGPGAVLAYPRAMLIDGAGNEIGPLDYEPRLDAPTTWKRLARWAQISNLGCNEIFGLIRTDVLRRVPLQPILSSDIAFVAEVAMRGTFVQVPERLFLRREHDMATFNSTRDMGEVLQWLEPGQDPGEKRPRVAPKVTARVVRAALTSELPLTTRISAAAAFAAVYGQQRARVAFGQWRRRR